ncbi:MAG: MBOAT family protein [Candidatus Aminicenantes bacterium]|nr:MBOAT family protein [Candidatus Aminicenantes bacterium]
MKIQSLTFFGFTVAVLVLYYLLSRKKQNLLLLTASYVFYITISYYFALILMAVTLGNYFLGRKVYAYRDTGKKWLLAGIGFNLLALCFFKAAHFFVPDALSLLSRLGINIQAQGLNILLPIGLSFYVLQAISYLVDLYRKQIPGPAHFLDFALYLAYFPKLTAGPIERPRTFLAKLSRRRVVDNKILSKSFTLIIIGLIRKIVIADTLLLAIPAKLMKAPLELSPLELVTWVAVYLVGIYNDFCGYTNIVRGVSGFFGIELSRNFINPFFSRNFTEFWNRWHVTLSLWLRDYIYFPIGRALARRSPRRNTPANIILPPLLTMLASGLWHGFGLNFIAWGVLMGIFLIGERLLSLGRPLIAPDKRPFYRQAAAMVTVSLLTMVSLIVGIMGVSGTVRFFAGLFSNLKWVLPDSRVFIMFFPSFWLDLIQHRRKDELFFLSYPLIGRALLLAFAILTIFLFSQSRIPAPFVYQGF